MINSVNSSKNNVQGFYEPIQNLNHKKPKTGVLEVPYITKAPIHDTIEKKKLMNPKPVFIFEKSKTEKNKNKLHKAQIIFDIGAITISAGMILTALIKNIKKHHH